MSRFDAAGKPAAQSGEMHEEVLHLRGVDGGRPGQPLAARADVAALSGTEVQIYGVVDAGVAVTNVSGVGSRSGMLNGGLTDSLWGLRAGKTWETAGARASSWKTASIHPRTAGR